MAKQTSPSFNVPGHFPQRIVPWADKYVGLPFKDRGRSLGGCDCWGLVWLVMRLEAAIDLPRYDHIDYQDGKGVRDKIREQTEATMDWVAVVPGTQRMFDVVVLSSHFQSLGVWRATSGHVGIMANEVRMLHIEPESRGSVCIPVDQGEIITRIRGFYRHRSLAK